MSSSKQPLHRQLSWTLPANAIYGVCNLLLLVILTKFGSEAVAGNYVAALAITSPIFMLATLRFSTLLATDVRSTAKLSHYFQLRAVFVLAAIAIFSGMLLFSSNASLAILVLAVASAKSIEAFSDLCCGVQQRVERMDRIAISLFANGLLMAASFALIYILTRNLTFAVVALCVARAIVLLAFDIPMARKAATDPVFQSRALSTPRETSTKRDPRIRLLAVAAPLGVTAALISLTSNIPKYLIDILYDEAMLGLFGCIAIALQAGNLVFRAIELPAAPRLAKALDERAAGRFWKLLGSLSAIFIAIGVVGAALSFWLGGSILSVMYTPAFQTMGGVLALMMIGTAISQVAGMIESSMIAGRMTAVQIPMHCVTALGCFLLCWVLIPRYALYGAVLAVTICRFPFMLAGVWFLRQKLAEPIELANADTSEQNNSSEQNNADGNNADANNARQHNSADTNPMRPAA